MPHPPLVVVKSAKKLLFISQQKTSGVLKFPGPKNENVKEEQVSTDDNLSSDDYLINRTNTYSPSNSKALLNQIVTNINDGITIEDIKTIIGSENEEFQEGDVL